MPTAAPGDAFSPLATAVYFARRIELRVEELVELRRLHPQHRLLAVDEALALHLDRHPQRGGRGALADARLQDEEATLFDGELDVAHVAEVVLQRAHHLQQLGVALREVVRHGVERFGDADTGDDVLALGVGEEVAVRAVLAGRGVAGERDARAGVVALVAEDHRLHVDGGAEVVGDALELAVVAGAPSVPRTEHRLDRVPQLLVGILREVDAGVGLDDVLERRDETLEIARRKFGIGCDATLVAQLLECLLEAVTGDVEHDLAEHLHEPAVGVEREPLVGRLLGEALHRRRR